MAEFENGASTDCSGGEAVSISQGSRDVPDMSPLSHYLFFLL